ncbi:hypothetical protein ACU686_12890 [Yinghuangia aomiensis]
MRAWLIPLPIETGSGPGGTRCAEKECVVSWFLVEWPIGDAQPPARPELVSLWGATEEDVDRARQSFADCAANVGVTRPPEFTEFTGDSNPIRRPDLPGVPLELRLTGSGSEYEWRWYSVPWAWWVRHGRDFVAGSHAVPVDAWAPDGPDRVSGQA